MPQLRIGLVAWVFMTVSYSTCAQPGQSADISTTAGVAETPHAGNRKIVPNSANPVIRGNNLYAPDIIRHGAGWNCYYGGWKSKGQVNDRIYLGTSPATDITGPWTERLVISNGVYEHVNDPTVVVAGPKWMMLYTAAMWVGTGKERRFRDWINFSTADDGTIWKPDTGTTSTEIAISDPSGILNGSSFTDIARPSLVQDGAKWKLWFDGKLTTGGGASYLAESNHEFPDAFQVIHKYESIEGFPGFMEPDVARRADGTFVAVVQRHFKKLFYGTSSDGINFTLTEILDVKDPGFGRGFVSNPGLIYDQTNDKLLGVGFGMTDNKGLTDHNIGFGEWPDSKN